MVVDSKFSSLILLGWLIFFQCLAGIYLTSCRRAIRPHDRAQLHNNQGVVYLNRKEYDRAERELKMAVELSPQYADAYHNLGVLYEQTGDLNRAEESYLTATKKDHKFAQPHNGLCSVYLREGQYKKGIKHGKKALKKNPNIADPAFCMGICFVRLENPKEAETALRRATDIDPNHYLAHNALAKVYLQDGRYDDAINRLLVAVEILPSFEEAWRNLSFAYYQKGDFIKATEYIRSSLGINPNNSSGNKLYAAILLKQARNEPLKAITYCQEAVEKLRYVIKKINSQDGEALANLGLAKRCVGREKRKAGDLETGTRWLLEAEKTLKYSIEVEPENCYTYLYLGELQLDEFKNKQKAGEASLIEAINCSRKYKNPLDLALFKLGSHYMETKRVREGKKYLCEFLNASDPSNREQIAKAQAMTASLGGC